MDFSLREFIKKGLKLAIANKPDYEIILNSASWLDKGVLLEEDLAEIQSAIDEKNKPIEQNVTELNTEE